ncbi:hypothetical protein D3C73_1331780 [compost metagenome]
MTGGAGHRAVLAPAGHASIDQAWVACLAFLRSEAKALHDTGTHALDQHVGALDQFQDRFATLRGFQVGHHRALATVQRIDRRIGLAGDRD